MELLPLALFYKVCTATGTSISFADLSSYTIFG